MVEKLGQRLLSKVLPSAKAGACYPSRSCGCTCGPWYCVGGRCGRNCTWYNTNCYGTCVSSGVACTPS